jgi:hypothetical protein
MLNQLKAICESPNESDSTGLGIMPGFATWQGLVNLADLPIWQRQSGNAAFGAGKSRFSG